MTHLELKIYQYLSGRTAMSPTAAVIVAQEVMKLIDADRSKQAPTDSREAFEDAALAHAKQRVLAGKAHFDNGAPMTKENLFWRKENGEYGVLMFNAAWWGWQAAHEHLKG